MQEAFEAHKEALRELQVEELHKLDPKLEEMANNRVRELLEATGEPIKPNQYKDPFQYYEPAEGTGGLPAVCCTCGWKKHHLRMKVLQQAALKHLEKTGHKPK